MNKIDRLSFNWLAYEINNRSFARQMHRIKGIVTDLGCGTSPYREDIIRVADQYIGIDWSHSFHDLPDVDVLADLSVELPLTTGCIDTVVSFQVMEHLTEPGKYLHECHRILRSGGTLLLTVPFNWHVHESPYDYYRYTRYGLSHLLSESGFVDVQVEENTGFWQMWVLKFNYHSQRFSRGLLKLFWIPIWFIDQTLAPFLDRYDRHPQETASYTVVAQKP